MPRIKSTHKAPLTLVESSNNGQVHEYGSPKLRSLHPCTAKVVSCSENVKWVSPDCQLTKQQFTKKNAKDTTKNSTGHKKENSKRTVRSDTLATGLHAIHIDKGAASNRKPNYRRLDFVHDGSPCYNSDDNKENVDPQGTTPPTVKRRPRKRIEEATKPRQYLSATTSRVNRM